MDLSEDVRAAHKRTFLKFFEQTEYNVELKKALESMFTQNRRRCIVNLSHFYHHREGTDLAGRKLLQNTSERHIEVWELVSISRARKYSGTVDIWLSILFSRCQRNGQSHCLLNQDPLKSYSAMAQHSSQWVWFRKLFVLFSSYTYANTLKRLNK